MITQFRFFEAYSLCHSSHQSQFAREYRDQLPRFAILAGTDNKTWSCVDGVH